MTTTICGHDRDDLRGVLEWAIRDDKMSNGVQRAERCNCGGPHCVIYNDLISPAKLAEMLAEEGRRSGFSAFVGTNATARGDALRPWLVFEPGGERFPIVCEGEVDGPSGRSGIIGESFTTRHARAILLQWIHLPDGAREQAERVLRDT